MKNLLAILGCLVAIPLNAQVLILSGQVINEDTREPVPYCNISLLNTTMGTSTGEAGNFELRLPKEIEHAMLSFSSLGYETRTVSISDFFKEADHRILLKPRIVSMPEIAVRDEELSDREILIKALYSNNLISGNAFDLIQYYHGQARAENGDLLYEADALIKEKAWTNAIGHIILQKRNRLNNENPDAPINRLYFYLDKWKFPSSIGFPCNLQEEKCGHQFLFTRNYSIYDNRYCFVIRYISDTAAMKKMTDYLWGNVIVDVTDYSIVRFEMNKTYLPETYVKVDWKRNRFENLAPITYSLVRNYRLHENKYYPAQIELYRKDKIAFSASDVKVVESKHYTNTIRIDLYDSRTYDKNTAKQDSLSLLNYKYDLNQTPYDSAFWSNFNFAR